MCSSNAQCGTVHFLLSVHQDVEHSAPSHEHGGVQADREPNVWLLVSVSASISYWMKGL